MPETGKATGSPVAFTDMVMPGFGFAEKQASFLS
jgi:hypothetical protein